MPVFKKRVAPLDKQEEFESRRCVDYIFPTSYTLTIVLGSTHVAQLLTIVCY